MSSPRTLLKKSKTMLRVFREEGVKGIARVLLHKIANSDRARTPAPAGDRLEVAEIWTDYMAWLNRVNAGMLCRPNVYCFDYALRHLPSAAPIVEIGSFCGLSTNMITYLKERNRVRNPLITCDKWLFENADQGAMVGDSSTVSHVAYRDYVKDSYIRNIRMFSRYDLPYTFEMISDDFFNAWSNREKRSDVLEREFVLGGPISFCYIDGNHSYPFAKRDFENVDRFLEPGGFILFDDSEDGTHWGVCGVVQEVLKLKHYQLVTKNPNYFFRKL